jgi:hypothetical protein
VPAILLAAAKQREMVAQAVVDDRRRVLVTPFHTRDITTMLDELLADAG